jgi:cystathionine beta-synthase
MIGLLDQIGNTPMVEVKNLDTGLCKLYLKLENVNPGGSIKDRMALYMILDAEEKGLIQKGGTLIEATNGNTGVSMALIAKLKGYKFIAVVPDKMSKETINHIRALGSQVVITRSDVLKGHPDYYQDKAVQLSREIPGSLFLNQYENSANVKAHEMTTGPEIITQLEGKPDAVVCGVSSGGTLSGLTRFFKKQDLEVEMVLADPKGSILADFVKTDRLVKPGTWTVEGIGKTFIPAIADFSSIKKTYTISDQESIDASLLMLEKEGILGGCSSGTLLAAALRYCKEQTSSKKVVTFVCDTGEKQFNKFWDPNWLLREGYAKHPQSVTIFEMVETFIEGQTYPSVESSVSIFHAYNLMRTWGVECIAVTENDDFVGVTDINRIIRAVKFGMQAYAPIASCMAQNWTSVQKNESVIRIRDILAIGNHPVLFDGDKMIGVVSPKDFMDHWRLQLKW